MHSRVSGLVRLGPRSSVYQTGADKRIDLVLSRHDRVYFFGFMLLLLPRIHLSAFRSRLPTFPGSGKVYAFTPSLQLYYVMRRCSVGMANVEIKELRGTICCDEDVELI